MSGDQWLIQIRKKIALQEISHGGAKALSALYRISLTRYRWSRYQNAPPCDFVWLWNLRRNKLEGQESNACQMTAGSCFASSKSGTDKRRHTHTEKRCDTRERRATHRPKHDILRPRVCFGASNLRPLACLMIILLPVEFTKSTIKLNPLTTLHWTSNSK